jgi:Flp pilus assembly protein TadG
MSRRFLTQIRKRARVSFAGRIMARILRKLPLQNLAADTRGSEIAEAAAVLPVMFMVLLGIFWFGQAFRLYGTITRAAQDGARAGAAPYCTTCTSVNSNAKNAVNAINSALLASHLDPGSVPALTTTPTFNACGTAPTSCQAVPGSNVCVQSPVQLYNTATQPGGAGVCGVAVTFQYPYQFWLPFTSLNNQQIMLTASARVRIETQ